jgi:hypothetical protein
MTTNHFFQGLEAGATTDGPKIWLRLEGLCWLIAASYYFTLQDYSWKFFALFFLVPDISFFGYAFGTRVGAYCYNTLHSSVGPIIMGMAGWVLNWPVVVALATIWICHIGFDRALAFGLKYTDDFKHTHLGFPYLEGR